MPPVCPFLLVSPWPTAEPFGDTGSLPCSSCAPGGSLLRADVALPASSKGIKHSKAGLARKEQWHWHFKEKGTGVTVHAPGEEF